MIKLSTSHYKIWDIEFRVADIIKKYQDTGSVVIDLNSEGPCAFYIRLYQILDYICEKFNLDKSKITIITNNANEEHDKYHIVKRGQHWIVGTVGATIDVGYNLESFTDKQVDQNLFGCLYNKPSWDRLCILSYVNKKLPQSIVGVNGTWDPDQYNTYNLNDLIYYAPEEFFTICDYLKTDPKPLSIHNGIKPLTYQSMTEVFPYYNNFFVDIVAETYHQLTFFLTEKTVRPMIALTPFIVMGAQGFLSTLQSTYGFKTFSHWWDESYDDYQNYERVKRIYKVIDSLSVLSVADRQAMYLDMQSTLLHNHHLLMEIYKNYLRIKTI